MSFQKVQATLEAMQLCIGTVQLLFERIGKVKNIHIVKAQSYIETLLLLLALQIVVFVIGKLVKKLLCLKEQSPIRHICSDTPGPRETPDGGIKGQGFPRVVFESNNIACVVGVQIEERSHQTTQSGVCIEKQHGSILVTRGRQLEICSGIIVVRHHRRTAYCRRIRRFVHDDRFTEIKSAQTTAQKQGDTVSLMHNGPECKGNGGMASARARS